MFSGGGFVGGILYSHVIQCPLAEDFLWILGPQVAGSVETALVRGVRAGALGFGFLTGSDRHQDCCASPQARGPALSAQQ